MSTYYFDYFSHINLSNRVGQVFNGGDNGTKLLFLQIMDSYYYKEKKQYLILPKGFNPTDEIEKMIVEGDHFQSLYVTSLEEVDYDKDAILFVPLVCGKEMIVIDKLKRKNPGLRVYGRVHDKNHNFPYDFYDRYYWSGINRLGLHTTVDFFGKKILFALKYGKWISNFDKVFTVSNYSMQKLKHRKISYINYYYQGILDYYIKEDGVNSVPKEDFILFVNGGRPEKNSLRTIEAFLAYKAKNPSDKVKLYITSTKKEVQKNLIKKLKRSAYYDENAYIFLEYISYADLQRLYRESAFLLFTTKGEGFGMPALESAMSGRPVLASWSTSVPEVLGASVRYVDPFSIKSIEEGIAYMRDEAHLKMYEDNVKRRVKIAKQIIKEDVELLIREIYED